MAMRKTDKPQPATLTTKKKGGWGTPDWRDESAYADLGDWHLDRWRWEFLRRRDDYRTDFVLAFEEASAAGYIGYDAEYVVDERASHYELDVLYNPGVSDWGDEGPQWYNPRIMLTPALDAGERWWQFKTLTFDLGKPLSPQLEAAKELLLQEQGIAQLTPEQQLALAYGAEYVGSEEMPLAEMLKKLDYRPRAPKYQPTTWALYLRVIDARIDGASLSQITEILPSHMSRRDSKAAHNVYEQARALQFRF